MKLTLIVLLAVMTVGCHAHGYTTKHDGAYYTDDAYAEQQNSCGYL